MNLQDQVIYRCIHAACARQLPRRVNFCPWCGTGQHAGVHNPSHVARPAQPEYHAAPEVIKPPADVKPAMAPPAAAAYVPEPVAPPPPPPPAAPAPQSAVPPTGIPPVRTAANPPRREPVRLRYWLIALAALWLIWLYAKPDSEKKIEARIENAVLASKECRFNDAQSELIALRMTKATTEQLQRLQAAINDNVPGCNKKKAREKAWQETRDAVENLLGEGEFARALARVADFNKRHKEDPESRKLKARINQQKADAAPVPLPVPVGEELPPPRPVQSSASTSQSVRNLIDEAERALRAGDYRTASDKLEICMTMVDEGNRECAAFKIHADRMLRDKERCLAAGRPWLEDRCR